MWAWACAPAVVDPPAATPGEYVRLEFTAADADPAATVQLGTQLAQRGLDPIGELVVYLHGAGSYPYCGAGLQADVLGELGYHVFMPCYVADYALVRCGDDVGGCRLEAFEGVDHSEGVEVAPPDAIETRVVRALQYLDRVDPDGGWASFLDGDQPRWDRIVVSGLSHGATSAGLIGQHRAVDRVVMLSGPNDLGQPWLSQPGVTPVERYWGFTHTADEHHDAFVAGFEAMGLPGELRSVDGDAPPFGGSHRLETSVDTADPHGSVQAGPFSPKDGDAWAFEPVWRLMYGGR